MATLVLGAVGSAIGGAFGGAIRKRISAPGPASGGMIPGIIWRAPSASTSRGPVSPQSRL